jgi:hypothetical protein
LTEIPPRTFTRSNSSEKALLRDYGDLSNIFTEPHSRPFAGIPPSFAV